ncbi:uncharacterized protein LOC134283348 isoform X2 [Saccostrea cucullata]|uniref:uncharacterized protein LOC134283348 isoform X2 n=1 Tax=Saccostrea cuccullata TaxID=36930 RepID=UPI002ED2BAB6
MVKEILQYLLLLSIENCSFVNSECSGIYSYRPCCIGEKWDESLQKCRKCPVGHYGVNCSLTCDIPYYGYRCSTGRCACNRISCQISTGCHRIRGKDINDKRVKFKRGTYETKTISMETQTTAIISTKTSELATIFMQQKIKGLSSSALLTEALTTLPRTNKTDLVNKNTSSFPYILCSIILLPLLFVIAICLYKYNTSFCVDTCMFSVKIKGLQSDEIQFEHAYEHTDRIYVNTGYWQHYDIMQETGHQSLSPKDSETSYESLKSLFSLESQDKDYDDVANVI